jgi:hypothetical protein
VGDDIHAQLERLLSSQKFWEELEEAKRESEKLIDILDKSDEVNFDDLRRPMI